MLGGGHADLLEGAAGEIQHVVGRRPARAATVRGQGGQTPGDGTAPLLRGRAGQLRQPVGQSRSGATTQVSQREHRLGARQIGIVVGVRCRAVGAPRSARASSSAARASATRPSAARTSARAAAAAAAAAFELAAANPSRLSA